MTTFRHAVTGVVVSVADGAAARLGPDWVPLDAAPRPGEATTAAVPPPRRRRSQET